MLVEISGPRLKPAEAGWPPPIRYGPNGAQNSSQTVAVEIADVGAPVATDDALRKHLVRDVREVSAAVALGSWIYDKNTQTRRKVYARYRSASLSKYNRKDE